MILLTDPLSMMALVGIFSIITLQCTASTGISVLSFPSSSWELVVSGMGWVISSFSISFSVLVEGFIENDAPSPSGSASFILNVVHYLIHYW